MHPTKSRKNIGKYPGWLRNRSIGTKLRPRNSPAFHVLWLDGRLLQADTAGLRPNTECFWNLLRHLFPASHQFNSRRHVSATTWNNHPPHQQNPWDLKHLKTPLGPASCSSMASLSFCSACSSSCGARRSAAKPIPVVVSTKTCPWFTLVTLVHKGTQWRELNGCAISNFNRFHLGRPWYLPCARPWDHPRCSLEDLPQREVPMGMGQTAGVNKIIWTFFFLVLEYFGYTILTHSWYT